MGPNSLMVVYVDPLGYSIYIVKGSGRLVASFMPKAGAIILTALGPSKSQP